MRVAIEMRYLTEDPTTGTDVIKHLPNAQSGGQISHSDVQSFLAAGANGPEHQALREGAHALGFRRGGARGKLILARRGGEFFEFQFQLFDQPRRALGALPVQFALELLDPQLEMRDQRSTAPLARWQPTPRLAAGP
jgi:hypothetical protein